MFFEFFFEKGGAEVEGAISASYCYGSGVRTLAGQRSFWGSTPGCKRA